MRWRRTGAAAISLVLGSAGLMVAPLAAQAAPIDYLVTAASDDAFDPEVGSLRAVLEQVVAESSDPSGGPKDFVVRIGADVGEIVLDTDLLVEFGDYAKSFSLFGAEDTGSSIDLDGSSLSYQSDVEIESLTFSDLRIVNGEGLSVVEGTSFSTSATNLEFSDLESVRLSGETSVQITGVQAARVLETKVTASPQNAGGMAVSITGSAFEVAPVEVGADRGAVSIQESSFTGNTDETALEVFGAGDGDAIEQFTFANSEVAANQSSGLFVVGAMRVLIEHSAFTGNEGDFGALIDTSPLGEADAQTLVTDSDFSHNDLVFAPLQVIGSSQAVTVQGNEFRENFGEQSGALLFDAWLSDGGGGGMMDDRLSPRTFRFAENRVVQNESGNQGSVELTEWVQHEDARAQFEANLFAENSSVESGADVSAQKLGEGRVEADEILSLVGNTFVGSSGNPGAGQSVSIGWVDAAHLMMVNNTFDLEDGPEAAVGIAELAAGGEFTVSHNTFVGGGVEIAGFDDADPSPVRVASTVFDTPVDPFFVDCDCEPVITLSDVVTRVAAPQLAGVTVATQAEIGLEPLSDNGGPVATRLPGVGSVLLGAALQPPTAPKDQRGVPRPTGAGSDIGAVERVSGVVALVDHLTVTEGEDAIVPVIRDPEPGFALELPAEVTVQTQDGTAVRGTDYAGTDYPVAFPEPGAGAGAGAGAAALATADGQRSEIEIPTIARSGTQGDRAFSVVLTDATNGMTVGDPATITITIRDSGGGTGPGTGPGDGGHGPDQPGKGGGGTPLSNTGGNGPVVFGIVGALLLLGGLALLGTRKRRAQLHD